MNYLYHITNKFDYVKAKDKGIYDFCTLKKDGFIHLSKRDQFLGSANNYFKGQSNLILFEIDPNKLEAKLVYENTLGGNLEFPHLYGPLNLDAIVRVIEFVETRKGFVDVV
jgi:uncharacterized protein (DUF952 family)